MQTPNEPLPGQLPLGYAGRVASSADEQHLNLLKIFHYVLGGITLLFSCIFIIHIVMGLAILNGAMGGPPAGAPAQPGFQNGMPPQMGWIFVIMGSTFVLLGWTLGILLLVSGRSIARRRRRMFSIVVAGINCVQMPLGTILGIFTILVLARDSVKAMYEANQR